MLLFVLWAVILLSFVSLTLSKGTRGVANMAIDNWDRLQALYRARGACVYAMFRVGRDVAYANQLRAQGLNPDVSDGEERDRASGMKLRETPSAKPEDDDLWAPRAKPYEFKDLGGKCKVYITDESGKVDLNKAPVEMLKSMVQACGVAEADADIIVDSILDWRDADDLTHLHGAETEYYEKLDPPYEAKNGSFESVGELLLVRGVTARIFEKLRPHLTIFGTAAINLNFASAFVMKAIPYMPDAIVDDIVSMRNARGLLTAEDLALLLGSDYAETIPLATLNCSRLLDIRAVGKQGRAQAAFDFIVFVQGTTPRVLAAWPD